MSINAVTCPVCEDQLPESSFNPCGPDLQDDGLIGILIARPDAGFDNVEDPQEHIDRTSDDSSSANAVRRLVGVGSWAAEFGSTFKIGRKTNYQNSVATLTLKIYDNNETNYEMARLMGCNSSYAVWGLANSNHIYGGNDGMVMVLNAREPQTEELTGKKYIEIQGIYEYKNMPPRNTYPLAGELTSYI
jgi:hypothetical protein